MDNLSNKLKPTLVVIGQILVILIPLIIYINSVTSNLAERIAALESDIMSIKTGSKRIVKIETQIEDLQEKYNRLASIMINHYDQHLEGFK